MPKKKILIVTDDAGESYEILYAKHRFEEAGFIAHIAATQKKRLNAVIHDFYPGWNTYIEKAGYLIEADLAIKNAKAKDYAALLLIGGRAPEFLRHHEPLLKLVRDFDRQGKWLFAICHGIQVLLAAGIGKGRTLTCYENVRLKSRRVAVDGAKSKARWMAKSSPRKRGKAIRTFTATSSRT